MKVSMLLYPVDDIDTALPLFVDGLGLNVKFRDGDRYCALDGGPLTIALVAGDEQIVERAALTLRVDEDDDLYAAMARVVISSKNGFFSSGRSSMVPRANSMKRGLAWLLSATMAEMKYWTATAAY